MSTDDFMSALDLVISRTGVERYRYLCTEHPDPAVRASYRAWVLREARGEPHPAGRAVPSRRTSPAPAATTGQASGCGPCGKSGPQRVRT